MTPRDVLVKARELLAEPGRWTQETAARDAAGLPVGATSDAAVCWCLIGALDAVRDGTTALAQLRRTLGCSSVSAWNDAPERTHADVLALLDRAIAKEEAPCVSS